MDNRFLSAFTDPSGTKILGKKLYPFCLKYRVRLLAINSPLVVVGRDIEALDIVLALQICSESKFAKMSFLDYFNLYKLQKNKDLLVETIVNFKLYAYQIAWPKFWEKNEENNSSGSGISWPLMVISNLISSGISEERAWNMPECQAVWYSTSFIKLKGGEINVLTTEEEEFIESNSAAGDQVTK